MKKEVPIPLERVRAAGQLIVGSSVFATSGLCFLESITGREDLVQNSVEASRNSPFIPFMLSQYALGKGSEIGIPYIASEITLLLTATLLIADAFRRYEILDRRTSRNSRTLKT